MYKTILVTLDGTLTDRAIIEHIKLLAKLARMFRQLPGRRRAAGRNADHRGDNEQADKIEGRSADPANVLSVEVHGTEASMTASGRQERFTEFRSGRSGPRRRGYFAGAGTTVAEPSRLISTFSSPLVVAGPFVVQMPFWSSSAPLRLPMRP